MPRLDIETRREQLTEAAVRIALREGLDNTTIRRVATEAGVSLGTVHYCFAGKAELLEAVVGYLFAREFTIEQVQFDPAMELKDAIRHGFRAYWSNSGANRDYQRLVYELVTYLIRQEQPVPELAKRVFENNYAIVASFLTGFEETFNVRIAIDRMTVCRMIVAMTDGVALAWLASQDEEKALATLDTFAEVIAGAAEPA